MIARLARGDIVLTRFPFTDLSGHSVRPAIVVSHGVLGEDVILAGISSVIRQSRVATDVLIDTMHREFSGSGLKVASVLRMHKLVTVERSVIVRRLGRVGPELLLEMDRRLRSAVGL